VQCVKETGPLTGNLADGAPHAAIVVSACCIPTTNAWKRIARAHRKP